jgi:hypothetical protein
MRPRLVMIRTDPSPAPTAENAAMAGRGPDLAEAGLVETMPAGATHSHRENMAHREMVATRASRAAYRPDEQLMVVLADTANWTINGTQGQILGSAASLGHAIERAGNYANADAIVVSVSRRHPSEIVVPIMQLHRLRRRIAGSGLLAAS